MAKKNDSKYAPKSYPFRHPGENSQVTGRVINPPRVGVFGSGTGRIASLGKDRIGIGPVSDRGKGV